MTESTPGTSPDPAAAPPPAGGWAAPPPPRAQAGPAGFVYADVPNRVLAYIIDIIVLAVIYVVVGIVLAAIGIAATGGTGANATTNWIGSIILTLIALAISGAYFVYSWTNRRATIGMRALGLQIGNAPDGATITRDQAIRRWLALGAIFSIAQILTPVPLLGALVGLASLAWVIFLLYTTAKSPTKQGWHDVFANTMIVKAARSAG
jgi:uncharacterized RDD family membrane protein YckC